MNKDKSEAEASHRVPLSGDWSIWRTIGLRSAGFPVHVLDSLAVTNLTASADRLLDAAQDHARALARVRALASERLKSGLDVRYWRRALRLLRQQRIPDEAPESAVEAVLAEARAAVAAFVGARAAYVESWDSGAIELDHAVRRHAADPRLREAVAWQSPAALDTAFDSLLRRPEGASDSLTRQHARLVARYLQRYCAKNDTIGFFGPMAWATVVDEGPTAALHHGPGLIAERRTVFETWAILALAGSFEEEARNWLSPRLAPHLWLEDGTVLTGPLDRVTPVSSGEAELLRACDGRTPAHAIASRLGGGDEFMDAPAVLARLDELARQGVISWQFDIPAHGRPEQWLRRALAGIADPALRERFLESVGALETDLAALHAAAGEEQAVRASYAALARRFEAETGRQPAHRHGQLYAGRTLAYHECTRDVALELGPDWVRNLAAPLAMVLDSARWFTAQLAAQFTDFVNGLFDECCLKHGGETLPFDVLWVRLHATRNIQAAIIDDVVEQLHERWAALTASGGGERRITLSSAALESRAAQLFAAEAPGWASARHHSPDLLVAAGSVEDIRAGRYTVVLGEVHTTSNTLMQQLFVAAHAHPASLAEAMARDQPEPELLTLGRFGSGQYRFVYNADSKLNWHVEIEGALSWLPPERVLRAGEVLLARSGSGFEIRTRDGKRRFPATAFLGPYMSAISTAQFSLFAPLAHMPRVTIDNLVIARESWHFTPEAMPFAAAPEPAERFAEGARFARAHDMPRWMFYRTPGEVKPVYLDWQSPPYVEMLAAAVRAARGKGNVTLSEMLPTPDQAWLADAQGKRYTCELRIVAVDGRHKVKE